MPELYEKENFVFNKVPLRILEHNLNGEEIYTPTHWHQNIEFNLTTAGQIEHIIEGKKYVQKTGDLLIVNSGELHSDHWVKRNDHFEGITVQISRDFLERWLGKDCYFTDSYDPQYLLQAALAMKRFNDLHFSLLSATATDKRLINLDLMEHTFYFLKLISHFMNKKKKRAHKSDVKGQKGIKNILTYLRKNYQNEITLNMVAQEFSYTPSHLSRLFKSHVGVGFHDYVQYIRLMNCVKYLKENQDNREVKLLDCALSFGFPNVKSFINTFKRYFDCTPSEWLRINNKE